MIELIAALGEGVLAGFEGVDLGGGGVDAAGESGDFLFEASLLRIHEGDAAGEDDAQAGAQLIAHGGEALGLGGLALERVHLARDFFKDVVDAGKVLPGAFEAEFGEAFFGFEASDAGGFFDDGATIMWLGAEKLADALLADDGVALGTEAGAHEDVLDVAQAAELAVEEVFAFACAEEAASDDDFALLGGALEFAAADFEDDGLRAPLRSRRLLRLGQVLTWISGRILILAAFVVEDLAGLLVGDDFFGFFGTLAAHRLFVPVSGAVVVDCDLGLNGNGAFIGRGVDHGEGDFGHAEGFAFTGSAKDDILHVRATEGLGALLAEHPAHAVEDVGFSAPIGAHHHGNACSRHGEFRAVAKAFEAEDVDLFQFQHVDSEFVGLA